MKRRFHWTRGPGDAPDEVRREIDAHLELRAREFEAQGMDPEAARRAALQAFGDRGAIEDQVRTLRGSTIRQRQRRERLGALGQDLRGALRNLVRARGFTAAALLTLGLGIGATSAVFSVIRSVLLRPLPYPDSDRLVQLWTDHRAASGRSMPEWLMPPEFLEWQAATRSFSAMAGYGAWGPDLTGVGDPQSLTGQAVTWPFFEVLGVGPAIGRAFAIEDDRAEAEPVVILSDGFWRSRFGGDRTILGRTLQLNGQPWTVIGVMPPDFRPPVAAELWRPMRRPATAGCSWGCITWRAIGRLRPGVSFEQARADLDGIAARIAQEHPESNAGVGAWPVPLHQQVTGPTRQPLYAIGGAVLFVLLIGCVNLANLQLLRGAGRAREMSVRAAIGAGRGRLVRQLLTESSVLAVLGGGLGLLMGFWGSRVLASLVPPGVRSVQEIRLDGTMVACTGGLTVLAGFLFGLLPALHTARADLMGALRTSGRDATGRSYWLRRGLVVVELAVAVLLLVGAGLLGRSFVEMVRVDLGYRTKGLATAAVVFPVGRYREPARASAAIEETLTRLGAKPGIVAAEAVDQLPLLQGGDQDITAIPIGEALPGGKPFAVWYRTVTPGYLPLLEMRLLAGRHFSDQDRAGAEPVGIVNEEAAGRLWPGKSPIGRLLSSGNQQLTIVGVVSTGKPDGPNQPTKAELFMPLAQFPSRGMLLVVESNLGPTAALGSLRAALSEVDPLVPLAAVATMEERAGELVALPKVYALLVGIFAGAALLLALLGVYGVMAYSVSQRQREIGVRLALGAGPATIRRLVLGQGARLTLIGLLTGLGGAALMASLIRSLLFGVPPLDAATFLGVAGLLAAMALVACWIPARRAMRVDPVVVMREE